MAIIQDSGIGNVVISHEFQNRLARMVTMRVVHEEATGRRSGRGGLPQSGCRSCVGVTAAANRMLAVPVRACDHRPSDSRDASLFPAVFELLLIRL